MTEQSGETEPVDRRAGRPVDTGFTYGPAPVWLRRNRAALAERLRAVDRAQSAALVSGQNYLLGAVMTERMTPCPSTTSTSSSGATSAAARVGPTGATAPASTATLGATCAQSSAPSAASRWVTPVAGGSVSADPPTGGTPPGSARTLVAEAPFSGSSEQVNQ